MIEQVLDDVATFSAADTNADARDFTYVIQPETRGVVLLFRRGDHRPSYVAKIAIDDASGARTRAEAATLEYLRQTSSELSQTIPARHCLTVLPQGTSLLQPWIPGDTMSMMLQSGDRGTGLALARSWLSMFQGSFAPTSSVTLGDLINDVRQVASDTGCLQGPVESALRRVATHASRTIPLLPCHGDFSPHHVIAVDGTVRGVVDWELYREQELPFYDWFRFLLSAMRLTGNQAPPGSRGDFLAGGFREWVAWFDRDRPTAVTTSSALNVQYGVTVETTSLLICWFATRMLAPWPEMTATVLPLIASIRTS